MSTSGAADQDQLSRTCPLIIAINSKAPLVALGPLKFANAPAETFTPEARAQLAVDLTGLGQECEQLPSTPFVKSAI